MRKAFILNSNLNLGHFFVSKNSASLNYLTIILLIFSLKVPLESKAQSISPSVLGTAAYGFQDSGNSIDSSVGEMMITTIGEDLIITQGFLQPKHYVPCSDYTLIAYPNPTKGILNVEFEGCDEKVSYAAIYDIFGKILFDDQIPDRKLDLNELKSGIFFLKVFNSSGAELGTIKIAKVSQ